MRSNQAKKTIPSPASLGTTLEVLDDPLLTVELELGAAELEPVPVAWLLVAMLEAWLWVVNPDDIALL